MRSAAPPHVRPTTLRRVVLFLYHSGLKRAISQQQPDKVLCLPVVLLMAIASFSFHAHHRRNWIFHHEQETREVVAVVWCPTVFHAFVPTTELSQKFISRRSTSCDSVAYSWPKSQVSGLVCVDSTRFLPRGAFFLSFRELCTL